MANSAATEKEEHDIKLLQSYITYLKTCDVIKRNLFLAKDLELRLGDGMYIGSISYLILKRRLTLKENLSNQMTWSLFMTSSSA
jgi:hypothetical protein